MEFRVVGDATNVTFYAYTNFYVAAPAFSHRSNKRVKAYACMTPASRVGITSRHPSADCDHSKPFEGYRVLTDPRVVTQHNGYLFNMDLQCECCVGKATVVKNTNKSKQWPLHVCVEVRMV